MSDHSLIPQSNKAPVAKSAPAAKKDREQLLKTLEQLEPLLDAALSEGDAATIDRLIRMITKLRAALGKPDNGQAAGAPPAGRRDDVRITGDVAPGAAVGDAQVIANQIVGRDRVEVTPGAIYIQHLDRLTADTLQELELGAAGGPSSTAERTYLLRLLSAARRVPLGQLELHALGTQDQVPEIRLDSIYVPLDTTLTQPAVGNNQGGARVAVQVLSAVISHRRLVVLGDPGSGKTTFVNYLTLCLAHACLDPASRVLDRLSVAGINGQKAAKWKYGALLPVRIDLREFAQQIPGEAKKGTCDLVWKHIAGQLAAANISEFASPLKKALQDGKCLVMFDGLDEISDASKRRIVRDSVTDFADTYQGSRFIVTCRVLSYVDPAWQLTSFPAVTLAPLCQSSIDCFIDGWYQTLARLNAIDGQRAKAKAAELRAAALDLHDLAQNPMLLTVMAVVHTYKGTLPRERARLYRDCVELLLWNWQRHKQLTPDTWELGIFHELDTREERLVNGLFEVAFQAHQSQGAGVGPANIAETDVVKTLRRYLDGDWNKAQRFCEYVEKQAGLLIGKGKDQTGERMYAFPHRGFQEFLAARHLVSGWDFSRRLVELAEKGDVWHEVLLLAVGHLVFNQQEITRPLDAINLLCKLEPPTTDSGWRSVWWAAEMLHIVGRAVAEQDEHMGKALVPRLLAQLVMLVSGGHLTAIERAQAGDVLGMLGDPRPGVCTVAPDMVLIPGGQVEIGPDAERHAIALKPYALSRYPITNVQFRVFVEDGGYFKREYWTARGWQWREKTGQRRGLIEDPVWGIDNRPVVAVTWHEAVAYTRWLASRTGRPFRLPTEAEWERAASGTERRKYPWGSRTSDDTANHRETGIGQTSAVGIFHQDCTPEGVYDMGGNVWEWCSSLDKGYPYKAADGREDLEAAGPRILRGGAFDNPRTGSMLHCSHRRPAEPHARVALIGFRVALSEK